MTTADPVTMLEELRALEARVAELRARIAGGLEREQLPADDCPMLVCRVGEERFAILQSLVVDVVMMAKLTAVPETAPWIAGLLNLRGQNVVVLDTLTRMTRAPRRPLLSDRIVVCAVRGRRIGLIVQEILAVETIPSAALHRPGGDVEQAPYLLGTYQREGVITLALSVVALLDTSSVPAEATGC